ncbi:MAG: hypothetical protein IJY05_02480 [Clostridia bacterium]|nr:hypothetical protein [Clostridia bacterium]
MRANTGKQTVKASAAVKVNKENLVNFFIIDLRKYYSYKIIVTRTRV